MLSCQPGDGRPRKYRGDRGGKYASAAAVPRRFVGHMYCYSPHFTLGRTRKKMSWRRQRRKETRWGQRRRCSPRQRARRRQSIRASLQQWEGILSKTRMGWVGGNGNVNHREKESAGGVRSPRSPCAQLWCVQHSSDSSQHTVGTAAVAAVHTSEQAEDQTHLDHLKDQQDEQSLH